MEAISTLDDPGLSRASAQSDLELRTRAAAKVAAEHAAAVDTLARFPAETFAAV